MALTELKQLKQWHMALMIVSLIIIGGAVLLGFSQKEKVGKFVWSLYKNPTIVLALNGDASQALEIGNYYFNAYGNGVYDLERAGKYFEKALELDPLVLDAWHQLARIDFLNGNFNDALFKINKQIELHGKNQMAAYYIRGLIHGYRREFNEAANDFLIFLEWDPKNWATHTDLAWVYFQKGDYANAEKIAQQGLGYFPDNPWLLNMRGISLLNLGNKTETESLLTRALEEARKLTVDNWEKAYPGNDPNVAARGLAAMIEAIEFNLALAVD